MFIRGRRRLSLALARLLLGSLIATLATAALPTPAASQNILDFLFGPRRPGPPPNANAYADPFPSFNPGDQERRAAPSGGVAFCVRLCDGRYFPIQRVKGANPGQLCNSFCPASATKVFSGGPIDNAVASDGSRYGGLPNAFAFRERVIDGCTCNGRDPHGLVALDASDDPTLRAGDIVATEQGFVVFNGGGGNRRTASFTPIESFPGLPAEFRERLAQTRIAPRNATPIPPQAMSDRATAAQSERDRRVQLDR